MAAPGTLRDEVARDLAPTRPLARPAVRSLALVPIAIAILVGVPALHRLRYDLLAIGAFRAFGLSAIQAAVGLAIVALALRESIPGRALSKPVLAGAFAAGILVPLGVLAITMQVSLLGPLPGEWFEVGAACFRTSAFAAVPAIAVAGVLVARAFPLRPGVAGALYGLGCGLMADAGLRLYCEMSAPRHVLLAHGGAIAAATVAGMILARVVEKKRRRA